MAVSFRQNFDGSWRGEADGVSLFVDGDNGQPISAQKAVAELVAANVAALRGQAASYLELFVDRAKSSDNSAEGWFLEEIDMRGLTTSRSINFEAIFTLAGDDSGFWFVRFRVADGAFWPHQFGRRQG